MENTTKLKIVQGIALVTILVGLIVMLMWVFSLPYLKSLIIDSTTMKFSTALCFLFSGIILYVMTTHMEGRERVKKHILLLFSILILLVMIPAFLVVVTGVYFDSVAAHLILDTFSAGDGTYHGLPSIGTILSFLFIGFSSLFSYTFSKHVRFVLVYAGSIVNFLGMVPLVGYVLNSPLLYYEIENISAGISLHATLLFFVLGIGFFLMGSMGMENCPYFKGMKNKETVMCGYDWGKHKK